MEVALRRYRDSGTEAVRVLDVGSRFLNGSYRDLIESHGWSYTGLDLEEGANVDVVADNPYHYPIETGAYDVVVTGSTAYAVLDLVSWTKELARVLRPGGLVVVITPSLNKPPTTQSPVDLWRMTEDALRLLFENTGILANIDSGAADMDVWASGIRISGRVDELTVAIEHEVMPRQYEFSGPANSVATIGRVDSKSVTVEPRHPSQRDKKA